MAKEIYEALCSAAGRKEAVLQDEPMKYHTTFRIGGPARFFVSPQNTKELKAVLKLCQSRGWPWYILGNGSNLLVSDKGFDGVIIRVGKGFDRIDVQEEELFCQAGALLSQISRKALDCGLTGLEFAAGIPGTLGGAAVMNAGAYGGELKDVLTSVRVLTGEGEERSFTPEELHMGYRTSDIFQKGYVVLGARFMLKRGSREKIRERMEELAAARQMKQPLEFPSAGSTFKRPEGHFAGKLIEEAGLKGVMAGGAQVSEKHSGFVINRDKASAADVIALCRRVSETVKERFGVELELEVRLLGDFT